MQGRGRPTAHAGTWPLACALCMDTAGVTLASAMLHEAATPLGACTQGAPATVASRPCMRASSCCPLAAAAAAASAAARTSFRPACRGAPGARQDACQSSAARHDACVCPARATRGLPVSLPCAPQRAGRAAGWRAPSHGACRAWARRRTSTAASQTEEAPRSAAASATAARTAPRSSSVASSSAPSRAPQDPAPSRSSSACAAPQTLGLVLHA